MNAKSCFDVFYSKSATQPVRLFSKTFPPVIQHFRDGRFITVTAFYLTLNAALDSCHVKWLPWIFYQSLMQLSHVSLEINSLHNYWIKCSVDGLLNNIPS